MLLDDFKRAVSVLDANEASQWRGKYINAFVDTASDFYRKHVGQLKQCSDGLFYQGYLWDCIKNTQVISLDEFRKRLRRIDHHVMVMWDLHSRDKIHVPNYWKFGRDSVLLVEPEILADNLGHLPEDIYVFDKELSRTLIATHEHSDDNPRICAFK